MLTELRTSINEDLDTVQQKLNQIGQKIVSNLKSNNQPDGLLTQSEREYIDCLKLNRDGMQVLFRKDEAHWET